ncbi:hypothetical protein HQ576_10090, partial [bacterium]|nr:hypothetical protein [bacterium]
GVAGRGGRAVYLETLRAQREALELARGSLRGALRYIGRAIHTASRPGVPVVVFNPLSWARADVCRATLDLRGLRTRGLALLDDQAKPVAFEVLRITKSPTGLLEEAQILFVAADVPSVGFRLYHAVASTSLQPPAVTEEAPAGTIDNEFFRITCDASFGGGIVRLLDKRSKREVLRREGGRTGNELVLLRESPERQGGAGELWTSGPMALSSRQPTRLEVRSGPVAMSITATGQVGGRCQRRQVVTIYRGVPRIDCTTELTYSGRDDLFAVTFPVGQPGAVPIVDGRFCVRTVRRGRQALDYRTTATAAPSGCQVHAAGQWASFGSSVRVAFADREARVLASFHLGPSAIVHTSDAAGRNAAVFLQRILAPRGIQCSAVSDKDDVSEIASPFRIVLAIAETNAHAQRLLASLDEPAREALAGRRKSQGYALAVLRDVAGRPGSRPATTLLILAPAAEQMTKALQDIASSIETTTAITVPVTANHAGIRTTAPDAGLAVLNQGTVAHSFEPDGRLALFLMHTAAWPSEAIERPLLPEQGLRVFRYALYPHGADWREAVVHRAAAAFNHPLLVLTPDRHDGPLASPTSFVSVEPENAVLCALKPSGYPLVAPATREAAAERRGVVLRLYEAYGEGPCDAHVRLFAPVQKAWRTNLLEERDQAIDVAGQDVAVKLEAAAIQTLEVVFGEGLPHLAAAKLDTVAEPVQPTPSRYWRAGLAAPLGNQPVAVSITGQPRIGQTADVRVALANHTDTRLTGTVWLVSPKLWDVTPRQFDYRIGPRSHTVRTVRVSVPTGTRGGQLAALTQHDGQTYRDAVVAGTYRPLTLTVERTATRIRARIRNPNPFLVSGRAEAICGPEAWPRHLVGHYSRWAVTPRVQAFAVAPESEAVVSFRIEPGAPRAWHEGFWCAIKLAYDGRVVYAAEPP